MESNGSTLTSLQKSAGKAGPNRNGAEMVQVRSGPQDELGRAKGAMGTTRGGRHSLRRFVLSFNDS